MSNVVKHKFASAKADGADVTKVQPSNWNDEHTFAGGSTGALLQYDGAQSDKVSWTTAPSVANLTLSGLLTLGADRYVLWGVATAGGGVKFYGNPSTQKIQALNGDGSNWCGIKAADFEAGVANPAASGTVRLGKGEVVNWYGSAASDEHGSLAGSLDLPNNTPTIIFSVALPSLAGCNGTISFGIVAKNATDVQAHAGVATFAAVNKGGVYTTSIGEGAPALEQTARSTGTLTDAWSITTGTNVINILVNANSSLAALTLLRVYWKLDINSPTAVTVV